MTGTDAPFAPVPSDPPPGGGTGPQLGPGVQQAHDGLSPAVALPARREEAGRSAGFAEGGDLPPDGGQPGQGGRLRLLDGLTEQVGSVAVAGQEGAHPG